MKDQKIKEKIMKKENDNNEKYRNINEEKKKTIKNKYVE